MISRISEVCPNRKLVPSTPRLSLRTVSCSWLNCFCAWPPISPHAPKAREISKRLLPILYTTSLLLCQNYPRANDPAGYAGYGCLVKRKSVLFKINVIGNTTGGYRHVISGSSFSDLDSPVLAFCLNITISKKSELSPVDGISRSSVQIIIQPR